MQRAERVGGLVQPGQEVQQQEEGHPDGDNDGKDQKRQSQVGQLASPLAGEGSFRGGEPARP